MSDFYIETIQRKTRKNIVIKINGGKNGRPKKRLL